MSNATATKKWARKKRGESYKNRNVKEQKLKTTSFKYPLQKKRNIPLQLLVRFRPQFVAFLSGGGDSVTPAALDPFCAMARAAKSFLHFSLLLRIYYGS